ncbi:hypothetical protein LMG10661_03472 [Ralstonia syzygii subsp. syzygii]|nr:hypothetical protein LMG10661_03472 [Ralstonia syzygii subsp. syzygii]
MPTKIALSGVQTLLTTQLAFDSADLRFRNAGTEEVMPLGRADAAPSAKTGPNVLRASGRLARGLHKISANVCKMEQAQAALDKAHAAYDAAQATIGTAQEALGTAETVLAATQAVLDAPAKAKLFQHLQAAPNIAQAQKDVALATKTLQQGQQDAQQAQKDIQAAGETLKIAFAKFCLRNELKSDYKTAAESAKIEYHGNKRFLGVSVATGAANLTATTLGIFTPVLVSATVTMGVTAAAALAVMLYLGYQLSSGPSKDGEAKARRAIVALTKSLDLLAGNAAKQQKVRAAAYRTYLAEKRIANKPEVRKLAKAQLIATLDEIARKDTTEAVWKRPLIRSTLDRPQDLPRSTDSTVKSMTTIG